MNSNPDLSAVVSMLVQANRILARERILDAFGHVSARHPEHPERFLISRNVAPALVAPEDIMTIDASGEPYDGDVRNPYLERFIHAAIYRSRPDVGSVVHSHSLAVIPFGVVPGTPLRPTFHMAGFLKRQAPVFEIREVAGEASDMLVRTPAIGSSLAQPLGENAVILMRGHGVTTVGRDVREAVFRSIYVEANARIQSEAMRLGPVTYLNETEAENTQAVIATQIDRAWELWCREIAR